MAKLTDHFATLVNNEFLQRSQSFMVEDLERSGLLDEDVYAEPLASVPPHKKRDWIIAAYKLPYMTADGSLHPHMHRIRLQYAPHVTIAMLKAEDIGKYTQPSREYLAKNGVRGNYPYMPSGKIKSDILLICEGEKKAAAAQNRFGCCVIGLGGAHCWRSEQGSREVHPEIMGIVNGREWRRIICLPDPDYGDNPDVAGGWSGLAMRIEADIVVLDGKLDDWLVKHEDFSLDLLLEAESIKPEDMQLGRQDLVDTYDLDTAENGSILYTIKNYTAILSNHPRWAGQIKRNDDTGLIEIHGEPFEETVDGARICTYLGKHLFLKRATLSGVEDAVRAVAGANRYSPLRDEILAEVWDGVKRAKYIFGEGRTDNEYAISEAWVYGYVKRILNPGCHWRLMVVLVGKQGVGKTGSAKWLVGQHGTVTNIHAGELRNVSKDVSMKFLRANVCLFDDIDTLHKADEGALKGMVSMESDYIRQSYAREEKLWKRRGIVMGTSNTKTVIPYDPTGNTRFVALEVHEMLDWAWLEECRGQILAEARVMKEPVIDFTVMGEFIEHDALYEACEEWVEMFNSEDKEIIGMCPRATNGKLYFKGDAFWFWYRKEQYFPNMTERKRAASYFKALGLIYHTGSVLRINGKPVKKLWGSPLEG